MRARQVSPGPLFSEIARLFLLSFGTTALFGPLGVATSLILGSLPLSAAEPPAPPVLDPMHLTFGGFVDTQYLYDFNRPSNLNRTLSNGSPFATTGSRTNEFNLNLAFFEAKLDSDRLRSRLALQIGSSVQANYQGESSGLGALQGSVSSAQLIQEAYVGYRIADGLWVDAGIFFSHLGFENFVSRDNWVYTRSLVAEFSPYYSSGAKLTYRISPLWTVQLLVLNGWQNILETNTAKSLGASIAYTLSETTTVSYNNYIGNEAGSLTRFFNELIGQIAITPSFRLCLTVDEGSQAKAGAAGGASFWYGAALLGQWRVLPAVAINGRVERFVDRDGVITPTGLPNGFAVTGASIGVDVTLHKHLQWRNEARLLVSDKDSIFPSDGAPIPSDKFLTTSLGLSF